MIRGRSHPTRPRPASTAVTEIFDSEIVVYCEKTQRMHCFNREAAIVWALCDGTNDLDDIVDQAATLHGVAPQVIRSNVLAAIDEFCALRILR